MLVGDTDELKRMLYNLERRFVHCAPWYIDDIRSEMQLSRWLLVEAKRRYSNREAAIAIKRDVIDRIFRSKAYQYSYDDVIPHMSLELLVDTEGEEELSYTISFEDDLFSKLVLEKLATKLVTTRHEPEVVEGILAGRNTVEIAETIGCTCSNVSHTLERLRRREVYKCLSDSRWLNG